VGKHENGYTRVERDAYQTRQAYVVRSLAEHVVVEGLDIWECAAGEQFMARTLEACGARVFTSDVEPYPGLDATFDFLTPELPPGLHSFDGIVTNPAWGKGNKLAEKFIAAGLARITKYGGFFALLLPADFDSAVTRLHLFNDPRFLCRISLTTRPIWFFRTDGEREAPKENCCWYLWHRPVLRHPGPSLTFHAVSRPDRPKEVTNDRAQTHRTSRFALGQLELPLATPLTPIERNPLGIPDFLRRSA
jgi:hypothetical protein